MSQSRARWFLLPGVLLALGASPLAADRPVGPAVGTAVPTPPRSTFHPVAPCRVADTRNAAGPFGGPRLESAVARTFTPSASACTGLPASATAYSLNLTVTGSPSAVPGSFLTCWPTGGPQPLVSTLNFATGETVANAAIVPVGPSGGIDVITNAATHLVIDVNGYFTADGDAAATYRSSVPQALPPDQFTVLRYDDLEFDTDARVTTGPGWKFTAATSGIYHAQAAFYTLDQALIDGADIGLFLAKNGSVLGSLGSALATSFKRFPVLTGGRDACLVAGDTLSFLAYPHGVSPTTFADGAVNWMSIHQVRPVASCAP